MKRIAGYVLVLLVAVAAPMRGSDVGKLRPVGVIQIYKEGESLVIATDSGDSGIGATLQDAFENLEDTTPGVIFLDTADHLLISWEAVPEIKELQRYLKPSICVCIARQQIDLNLAAEYLQVHHPGIKLKDDRSLKTAPELIQENGRLRIK